MEHFTQSWNPLNIPLVYPDAYQLVFEVNAKTQEISSLAFNLARHVNLSRRVMSSVTFKQFYALHPAWIEGTKPSIDRDEIIPDSAEVLQVRFSSLECFQAGNPDGIIYTSTFLSDKQLPAVLLSAPCEPKYTYGGMVPGIDPRFETRVRAHFDKVTLYGKSVGLNAAKTHVCLGKTFGQGYYTPADIMSAYPEFEDYFKVMKPYYNSCARGYPLTHSILYKLNEDEVHYGLVTAISAIGEVV
jgi:hypothetical protein